MVDVLIADDHPVVRRGLRELLEADDELRVIGEASDGVEAVEKALGLRPDVLLLDMNMPRRTGREVCEELAGSGVRILVLSAFELREDESPTISSSACGYLTKSADVALIAPSVKAVAAGGFVTEPPSAALLGGAGAQDPYGLSQRELGVLELLALGLQNKEIASRLWVAETTVKTHVSNILRKTGAGTRGEAVAAARRKGVLASG